MQFRLRCEGSMAISYILDRDLGVIFETWEGAITAADLSAYWKSLLEDPEALACRRTLADVRRAEIQFRGTEMMDLIRAVVIPKLGGRKWKTAIVADKPVQFGLSRQYGVFAADYSEDRIFNDCDSALKWLRGRHHGSS